MFTAQYQQSEYLSETSTFVTILVVIGAECQQMPTGQPIGLQGRSPLGRNTGITRNSAAGDRFRHRTLWDARCPAKIGYLPLPDKARLPAAQAIRSWTASPDARSNACTTDGRSLAPARASRVTEVAAAMLRPGIVISSAAMRARASGGPSGVS